jgi:hypothetical protein
MPAPLVHLGATVLCSHAGQATPTAPNPRVLVSGQPTVLLSTPYVVAGCVLPPPAAGNGPCVTAQWVVGAARLLSNGQPLILQTSQALCAPTANPLIVASTQVRALGT